MVLLVSFSTIFFYKEGMDPENIMGPYVTTIGDIVSMLSLFIAVMGCLTWLTL